jgi:hypothetical protein
MKVRPVTLLIGLLALLLAPTEVLSGPPIWTNETVRVLDYTTAKWDGMVAGMVDEFNVMLPDTAPDLVYRRMAERSCEDLGNRTFVGAIVVCSVPTATFVGMTGIWTGRSTMLDTRILLNDRRFLNERFATNTVCHELMHAVTGIRDNYDRRPKSSCVWGNLPTPGRFDAAYARKVYSDQR